MPLISIARPIIVAAAFGAVLALVGHFASLPALVGDAGAQQLPTSGIKNTKHNFGGTYTDTGSGTRSVVSDPAGGGPAGGTTDTCVFCHTPHGSTRSGGPVGPLWNRTAAAVASVGSTTYNTYSSSTLQGDGTDVDANGKIIQQPGDRSKLCLACHDGLLAVNTVANAPGTGGFEATIPITIQGVQLTTGGTLSNTGSDGYTRNIGTDLTNDHPIMVTMSNTTASRDTELRSDIDSATADTGRRIYNTYTTGLAKPHLINPGKVQCPTCHDPHLGNVTVGGLNVNNKFLRLNRFQQGANSKTLGFAPTSSSTTVRNQTTTYNPFVADTDQICIACHTRLGAAWTQSAHASSAVAQETYGTTAAVTTDRNFPANLPVWRAGCLNCHDTHTKTGAKRLLREGAVSGKSAIEQTCYQCHSTASVLTANSLTASDGVPNIGAEFAKTYRMPITDGDQGTSAAGNSTEVHSIDDADFMETAINLGAGSGVNAVNRHVECTDCHNPHRVIKADTILGSLLTGGTTSRRTHIPSRGTGGRQGNIASGVLRGAWGVEPTYGGVSGTSIWMSLAEAPTFTVKRGDPGGDSTLPVGKPGTETTTYLTREYQLCFKCHSSYANGTAATDFQPLKTTNARGGTASGVNGMTRYTDVAREFAVWAEDDATTIAVSSKHQGEATNTGGTACNGGDCTPVGAGTWDTTPGASTLNHRSWHPVIFPTGRSNRERYPAGTTGSEFNNIRAPFTNVGTQTMHCSDCHGSEASWNTSPATGPNLNQVQGPHGSNSPFLLKGGWGNTTTTQNYVTTNLSNVSGDTQLCGRCHFPVAPGDNALRSGYNGNHLADGNMSGHACSRCHIAVPHGWKNKAFLVNKRCVGVEGGQGTDCTSQVNFLSDFNAPPYYRGARNSFLNWRASGSNQYGVEDATCNNVGGGSGNMKDCIKSAP